MGQEKQFENTVKKWLKSKNIWYVKYFGNGYSTAGIPDLLCCVNGHFVAIEIKAENGVVSELQNHTLREIHHSRGIPIVLRPSGFESFKRRIEEILNN